MDERNEQRPDSADEKPREPVGPGPGPAARAAAEKTEPVRRGPGPAARAAAEEAGAAPESGTDEAASSAEPSSRVIDAGTSQELVIINYSNAISFSQAATGSNRPAKPHPSTAQSEDAPGEPKAEATDEAATPETSDTPDDAATPETSDTPDDAASPEPAEAGGETAEPRAEESSESREDDLELVLDSNEPPPDEADDEAPAPDESLVIVRNMADQFALDEHEALKPAEIPGPAATGSPAGAQETEPSDEPAGAPGASLPGFGATPPPFAKKEKKPEPEPAEIDENAERRRELADVLGVDWDSELDLRSARTARRPSSTVVPPVAPLAPSRGARPAREPAPRPVAFEPEIPLGPPPRASRPIALASGLIFVAATVLMALRVEPFHTWYYLFAWYPMLFVVNHLTALRAPRFSLFRGRAGAMLTMVAWSVPLWLVFEVFNFRLANWYYVGVPDVWIARRLGVIFAFATVLPGIFLLEEMLRSRGWFERMQTPAFRPPSALPHALLALGGIWALLVLVLPRFFFPLVWGIPVLLLEPWLWRSGGPSLLRELSEGRPGRIMRLLAVGLFCGLFWESANFFAGGKWIYTVPGFGKIKLFEMPLLGFIGFPPFALCCWVMARALVKIGLLPDPEPRKEPDPEPEGEDAAWLASGDKNAEPEPIPALPLEVRIVGIVGACLFSLAVLEFVDRVTVDSFSPRPKDVPGIPDGVAEYARAHGAHDVRGLLHLIEDGSLYMPGESSQAELQQLEGTCRLVLLRGIGTENARRLAAAGIHSVGDLALWKPDELIAALEQVDEPGWKPAPRRVNVWVSAARKEYSRR